MKKLMNMKDIPTVEVANFMDANQYDKSLGLSVLVDGMPALIFVGVSNDGIYSRDKLVVLFENKHPKWEYCFQTKYYIMKEPGKLEWGHSGEVMEVECLG